MSSNPLRGQLGRVCRYLVRSIFDGIEAHSVEEDATSMQPKLPVDGTGRGRATSVFANPFASDPDFRETYKELSAILDTPEEYQDLLPEVKAGVLTKMPENFHWIRMGSQSVELGWDRDALAETKADKIKLTANYYANSKSYRYTSVPIQYKKLTVKDLKPSSLYEMIIQGLRNDKPVFEYTVYIKTPAKGNGAASCYLRGGRFCLSFPVFGALEVQQWPVIGSL
ncbi:hypothetical protein TcWFU_010509 [Taenia crassiceps]|uniref:Fibronectin type-III domain-containing protein n=1 Tax=Taenia crassiceps TaxID=6207 RepID=A0ABR4Q414_9CEST